MGRTVQQTGSPLGTKSGKRGRDAQRFNSSWTGVSWLTHSHSQFCNLWMWICTCVLIGTSRPSPSDWNTSLISVLRLPVPETEQPMVFPEVSHVDSHYPASDYTSPSSKSTSLTIPFSWLFSFGNIDLGQNILHEHSFPFYVLGHFFSGLWHQNKLYGTNKGLNFIDLCFYTFFPWGNSNMPILEVTCASLLSTLCKYIIKTDFKSAVEYKEVVCTLHFHHTL